MVARPVVDARGSVVARLIILPVARCYDRSFGATIATFDRTIGRRSQLSVARCYDLSCDRSLPLTIDRTIDHRVPRLIVRSVTGCHECSYDQSHAGCHDCSYDRSQDAAIDRTIDRRPSRLIVRSIVIDQLRSANVRSILPPMVQPHSILQKACFPTIPLAIDIPQSFVISRPRVEIDRLCDHCWRSYSNHCRSVAHWPNRNQSYDPV